MSIVSSERYKQRQRSDAGRLVVLRAAAERMRTAQGRRFDAMLGMLLHGMRSKIGVWQQQHQGVFEATHNPALFDE